MTTHDRDNLIRKIGAYDITMMSGTQEECDSAFDEIVQILNVKVKEIQMTRSDVQRAINTERIYQEHKWGVMEEHPQSVGGYLTLMRVHLAKAEAAWASADNDKEALECLRKVLAIGVACGEQHGLPPRNLAASDVFYPE